VTPNNVVEGVNTTLTFTLSQPVPVGGLALNLTTTDTDLALGDIAYNLTNSSNIAAVQDLSVAGANSGTLLVTLAEGATVATLVVDSIIDDIAENVETISYTLNPPTGYSVIPASNTGSVSITNSPTVFGTSASEVITATDGASFTIFGNGGNDTLTGAAGNDLIYGGSEADIILGGAGNDTIFGNGGYDYINSGSGIDVLGLDLGNALVVLEAGEGYDVINNFQLGANKLMVSSLNNLSFTDIIVGDTTTGVNVIQGDDLLAVVAGQNASTFSSNLAGIFVV
jgi:Ca2+-binding RTX toxin-like protein